MSKNILQDCFIKQEKFKPQVLGGDKAITIRELTIAEAQKYQEILRDENKTQEDAVFFAVKCSMIEPAFFSDDELKQLNSTGKNLIYEIHSELPIIGKSTKEREEYFKKLKEWSEKLSENADAAESEEDEEKK